MKISKRKIIVILISAFIIIIGLSSAIASGRIDFFKMGKNVKSIVENDDKSIIAYVDGIAIEKLSLDLKRYNSFTINGNTEIPDNNLLNELISEQVILNYASNNDLEITYEEAEIDINDIYTRLDKLMDSSDPQEKENAKLALEEIKDVAEGMGISVEEYKIQYQIPLWQKQLTMNNVYYNFVTKNNWSKKSTDEKNEKYEEFKQELIAKANIQIIDE